MWTSTSAWGDSSKPCLLERQLNTCTTTDESSKLLSYLRKQLLKDLCLGFDCDTEWERLPADIRKYLIHRCLGRSAVLSDEQIEFLRSRLHMSCGLEFDTFIARSNYAVLAGVLSVSRASAWISGDQSRRSHLHLDPVNAMSLLDLFARTTPFAPPSLLDRIRKHCGFIYHQIGVGCKFFSVAFVADPEYQRELNCTFSYGPHVTQSMTRLFFTGIWIWSKAIQRLFLPIFLVRGLMSFDLIPANSFLNHANKLTLFSFTIANAWSPCGKTSKGLKSPSSADA
jgi:hypothetical protein